MGLALNMARMANEDFSRDATGKTQYPIYNLTPMSRKKTSGLLSFLGIKQ